MTVSRTRLGILTGAGVNYARNGWDPVDIDKSGNGWEKPGRLRPERPRQPECPLDTLTEKALS